MPGLDASESGYRWQLDFSVVSVQEAGECEQGCWCHRLEAPAVVPQAGWGSFGTWDLSFVCILLDTLLRICRPAWK